MARKLIERRKRGIFGKLILAVFWLANGLMALWFFAVTQEWSKMATPVSDAEKAGQGLGIAAGLGILLSIWACVAIVTGLLAFMTRGNKEITARRAAPRRCRADSRHLRARS